MVRKAWKLSLSPLYKEKKLNKMRSNNCSESSESRGGRTNYRPSLQKREKETWLRPVYSQLQVDGQPSRLVLTDVRG